MREVRLDYTKCGNAKYISHLDLNRVFFRAVRRAHIPIWFTEGYNPKPYFRYAQSLPLGIESFCESLDIRLLDDNLSNSELKERLNAVLPAGIEILRVHEPKMKPQEIYAAVYELRYVLENTAQAAGAIEAALSSQEIFILSLFMVNFTRLLFSATLTMLFIMLKKSLHLTSNTFLLSGTAD